MQCFGCKLPLKLTEEEDEDRLPDEHIFAALDNKLDLKLTKTKSRLEVRFTVQVSLIVSGHLTWPFVMSCITL